MAASLGMRRGTNLIPLSKDRVAVFSTRSNTVGQVVHQGEVGVGLFRHMDKEAPCPRA
jgi:hypothetical protein